MYAKGSSSAEIAIYEEIGYWGIRAKQFLRDIKDLGNVNHITLRMNSPGGEVFDGLAIYNILKNHPATVHANIEGIALSMGSVIVMSADTIEIADNGLYMIHNPWGFAFGDAPALRKTADVFDKLKDSSIIAYQRKVSDSHETLSKLMDEETWYNAEEALAAGFVDSITDSVAVDASYDLSQFRNMPESCPYSVAGGKEFKIKVDDTEENRQLLNQKNVTINLNNSDMDREAVKKLIESINEEMAGKIELTSDIPIYRESVVESVADQTMKGKTMDDDDIKGATEKDKVVDLNKVRKEAAKLALAEEKQRQDEIRQVFSLHGDAYREVMDKCLENTDVDVSAARQVLLDEIGKGIKPVSGDPHIESGDDSRTKYFAAAEKAFDQKFVGGQAEHDNEFLSYTLLDHAKHCLKMAGKSITGMTKMQIVGAAFTHSTSDFPLILENQIGKVLRNAYSNFPETWNRIAVTGSVSDFKVNSRYNVGSFNSLDTVLENQEFTHGSFGEEREQIQAATKGKLINLSRQMIINDDLGAFLRIAQMMGRAAQRTIGNDVYNVLFNNPLMSDGVALFSDPTHGNLATVGGAISVATLGAGKSVMRLQKDVNLRDTLNIMPSVLLAPVAKEDLAMQIIASETDPTGSNSRVPNPVRNMVEVITDPRLDTDSLTAWYLLADPAFAPTIEVAFLDGNQTPYLETQMGFTIDGVTWKVRLDYGTAAVDWRTGYKNPGA